MKKIVIIAALLPSLAFGFESDIADLRDMAEEYAYELPQDAVDMKGIVDSYSDLLGEEPNRQPKSRQIMESILGTWHLSYTIKKSYTDIVRMDNYGKSADGTEFVTGKHYMSSSSVGVPMACFYLDQDLRNKSGNAVTKGFYSIGKTIEEMAAGIAKEFFPVTGFRESTAPQPKPDHVAPRSEYNDETGLISLPELYYKGYKYNVTLRDTGGLNFVVDKANRVQ